MSIQEVSAEQLAELLHHYHQALGPDFSGESKPLVAAARLALLELRSMAKEKDSRRYFAKPGQAEWGC